MVFSAWPCILPAILFFHSSAVPVLANTEKVIFRGPETVNIPPQKPSLQDLHIDTLTPTPTLTRTTTNTNTNTNIAGRWRGKVAWFLLDGLREDQRYEVRLCWPATQPTAFTLTTHTLPAVFATEELITSLWEYSLSRFPAHASGHLLDVADDTPPPPPPHEREASILFLRIAAAADYFSTNATLMATPTPVDVDIILDPFLLGVLPRSLAPTAAYVVVVAAVSYLVARHVVLAGLERLVLVRLGAVGLAIGADAGEKKKKKKKKRL
ncbi:hypothetical protein P8C59_006336 [Phyllachora maydis]|uniref:Uncharacterized protein n=1 Tax=Phyllachora maydis TaxID=1825666 RepID=A0AAD9MEF4_9PEZI|nr:hypothetical protein P8C59_006336 [Phyllachora maydis]